VWFSLFQRLLYIIVLEYFGDLFCFAFEISQCNPLLIFNVLFTLLLALYNIVL
jgi:hypothetical protein